LRGIFLRRGTAEGRIETVGAKAVEKSLGLEQTAAALGSEADGICSIGEGLFVAPDDQLQTELGGVAIAEFEHLAELVAGVNVQQGEGNWAGVKGFLREAEHHGGVFTDGVEHYRVLKLRGDLAEDVNALSLEELDVIKAVARELAHR
jgi:hypothetical protein